MALNNNVYSPFMFRLAKKVGTIGPELAEQQMCKNGLMRAKEVTVEPERSRVSQQ